MWAAISAVCSAMKPTPTVPGVSTDHNANAFVGGGQIGCDYQFVLPAGPSVDPTATTDRTGWTVGGGVEWAFAPHWSVNLESDHYAFGTQTIILTNAVPVFNVTTHIRDQFGATTVGVNYYF